jgi:hypothetical protein
VSIEALLIPLARQRAILGHSPSEDMGDGNTNSAPRLLGILLDWAWCGMAVDGLGEATGGSFINQRIKWDLIERTKEIS